MNIFSSFWKHAPGADADNSTVLIFHDQILCLNGTYSYLYSISGRTYYL